MTIDDLLTPRALALIQRFLTQSTIWHDFTHIGGFVATYLEDGFACPLVLQIADEFRTALPDLFGHHPLTQAWAFKALSGERPIDIHADDAAVSLNFWITPDTANRNPDTGGLIIYTDRRRRLTGRSSTTMRIRRIRSFLAENGDSAIVAISSEPWHSFQFPPVSRHPPAGFCARLRKPPNKRHTAVRNLWINVTKKEQVFILLHLSSTMPLEKLHVRAR